MESIGIWIGTIVTFILGYVLGKRNTIIEDAVRTTGRSFKQFTNRTHAGTIKRPSAEDLERRKDPKKLEEEEAMRETFAKLMEEE